jgi:hypothetical protein
MESFARNDGGVNVVRVRTPDGDVWEVSAYGLNRACGVRAAAALRRVLSDAPGADDPEEYREAFADLVLAGVRPADCVVELASRAREAGADSPHGWRVVASLPPAARGPECWDERFARSVRSRCAEVG